MSHTARRYKILSLCDGLSAMVESFEGTEQEFIETYLSMLIPLFSHSFNELRGHLEQGERDEARAMIHALVERN